MRSVIDDNVFSTLRRPNFICLLLYSYLFLIIFPLSYSQSQQHQHQHQHNPHLLQPPVRDRHEKLKYGQSVCLNNIGDLLIIGANGFDKFKGAIYIYNISTYTASSSEQNTDTSSVYSKKRSKKDGPLRPYRIIPHDVQGAEERSKELRPQARGSGFGFSSSFSSTYNTLIIGAPGHEMQRGVLYIYTKPKRKTIWKQVAKLRPEKDEDRRAGDTLGWDVTVNEECTIIVASARGRRANNGEVFTFICEKGCMKCQEDIIGGRMQPPIYTDSLGPRGIRIRNNYGMSIGISGDGRILVVGCTGYEEETGAVYVYERLQRNDAILQNDANDWNKNGIAIKEKWILIQRLESGNEQKYGFFGFKVDINHNGDTIAVGADGEDNYQGAVYIYETNNGKSSTERYVLTSELRRDKEEREDEDNFGGSVALSKDGRVIVIGAPGAVHDHLKLNDHGVMYVYEKDKHDKWVVKKNVWLPESHCKRDSLFAWGVAIAGDGRVVAATAPDWESANGLAAFDTFDRHYLVNRTTEHQGEQNQRNEIVVPDQPIVGDGDSADAGFVTKKSVVNSDNLPNEQNKDEL